MLHYSNASSIEENRRYLVIKGGGACLVALASRGHQQRSWPGHQHRHQSRSLPERRGGRNNEYNANRCVTMHDKARRVARRALTRYEVIPVKGGKHPGKYPRCFAFSDRWTGGGKLCVCYARDVWRTNGLCIRIRLVVLSNFHVESIFIRVTDYFIWFYKDLIIFWF